MKSTCTNTEEFSDSTARPTIGKRVGGYRYLHRDALCSLSESQNEAVQRADKLAGSPGWNVLKLSPAGDHMSLLCYEDFFGTPFPELVASYRVELNTGSVELSQYPPERNRPVLHRKELLIDSRHPKWEGFSALSRALDEAALLREAHLIGYRDQWNSRLTERGFRVNDHRLELIKEPVEPPNSAIEVDRHRTALTRYGFSSPMQALARHGYLDGSKSILDYGCGKGDDLRLLELNGVSATGWDPYYRPDSPKNPRSIVNLGFVLNVIEKRAERIIALEEAFDLAEHLLVASVMLDSVSANGVNPYRDGVITARNTFQKYYSQAEFSNFISSVLAVDPIPVGPGIFFVFKDAVDAEEFLEQRSANHTNILHLSQRLPRLSQEEKAKELYHAHAEALDAAWAQYLALGRPPMEQETPAVEHLKVLFGSLKRGLKFLSDYHGDELIAESAATRTSDLRVYLALQLFSPRKKFSTYPERLRNDIKAFFRSRSNAHKQAKALLFSIGDPENIRTDCIASAENGVGALDPDGRALIIHSNFLERLSERLRVYIGCATSFYGDPSSADLIKIHIESGKLSLMTFDDFEGSPLPRLVQRVKLNFREQEMDLFEYGQEYESPYLYQKSRYIDEGFHNYEEQLEFDAQILAIEELNFSRNGPKPRDFHTALRWLRKEIQGFELADATDIPDLDEPCGKYHKFRHLVECGETQQKTRIQNLPKQAQTYNALAQLCHHILDPVIDWFGGIDLTYGFCGAELANNIPGRINPRLDQHSASEFNRRNRRICNRLGAAVDFIVPDESMAEVALWVFEHCQFDRIYFYGADKPLHVSFSQDPVSQITHMREQASGRRVPRVLSDPSGYLRSYF